jgi:hypothetical protein
MNVRKAQKHMQRASELMNQSQLGFGVNSKPATPKIVYKYNGKQVSVSQDGAWIYIRIQEKTWKENDDWYQQLKEPVKSGLHIDEMFASDNVEDEAARIIGKGHVRKKLLCYLLRDLMEKKHATLDTVVSACVMDSRNDELIKKVYNPMGFELRSRGIGGRTREGKLTLSDTGGLMTSTVKKIIQFCEEAEHSAVSEKRPREDERYEKKPRKDPRKDRRGHARDAHTPYDPQRELNAQHPLMNTPSD